MVDVGRLELPTPCLQIRSSKSSYWESMAYILIVRWYCVYLGCFGTPSVLFPYSNRRSISANVGGLNPIAATIVQAVASLALHVRAQVVRHEIRP